MAVPQPQFDKPYSRCEIQIKRDEDWRDTVVLRRLMADGSQADFDFSDISKIELFIRPLYDHSILIRKLSSDNGGIQFAPAIPGTLTIVSNRDDVIAGIPTGIWAQFLVATYTSGFTEELWRGPLIVHPGNVVL